MSIWWILLIILGFAFLLGFMAWGYSTEKKKKQSYGKWEEEETIIDRDELINLSFDKSTNRLTFKIQHYHSEPKISRYVQRNYQRFPVYEGEYSTRTRVVKNFNKIINPIKFVNEDILKLNLEKEFVLEILKAIGKTPAWRKKELQIQKLENEIKEEKSLMRNFDDEAQDYHFRATSFPQNHSNFWKCLSLAPFTFGFSFKGYLNKKQAEINTEMNIENRAWNEKHKAEIDEQNSKLRAEINTANQKRNDQIELLEQKIQKIENQEIKYEKEYEQGWLDLKDASNTYYANLANKKGVYIIWNKTKNKYYVGQSKNLKTRLMTLFKDGEPKNIIFAKDWYNGDFFVYKYFLCETKDQLDALTKRYIDEYSAFENGYNKTRGNN